MDVSKLSDKYFVRKLYASDVSDIFELCRKNCLYYRYCPPFVSEQSILDDMKALPPGKDMRDKFYVGYYDGERLIAVMDLIMAYPNEYTAFIGFFMTDVSVQKAGIGSSIIDELCVNLSRMGTEYIRLGWVRGNPQAKHFWNKNGFVETGATFDADSYTVIVAQRAL